MFDVYLREAKYKCKLTKKLSKATMFLAKAEREVCAGKAYVSKFEAHLSNLKPGEDFDDYMLGDANCCFETAGYYATKASDIAFDVLAKAAAYVMSYAEADVPDPIGPMDTCMNEFVYKARDIIRETNGLVKDLRSPAVPNYKARCKFNMECAGHFTQLLAQAVSRETLNRYNHKPDRVGGL